MSAANILTEAAEILTTEAEALRVCSTFEGDWGNENEAKAEYRRMLCVARKLRVIEATWYACILPYLCAAAFLVGYAVAKWLG